MNGNELAGIAVVSKQFKQQFSVNPPARLRRVED
jgi:hypothetical protein